MKPLPVRLFESGYRALVSVIPPNAPLSPSSRIQPDQRGKVPGVRYRNGSWGGYPWLKHEISLADVKQWSQDSANIGIRGDWYPGLDIDCTEEWLALEVEGLARRILGWAPSRVGLPPKRLLMYRTGEPFSRIALVVRKDARRHLIEFLGTGRQYLIMGQHPSGNRYLWDKELLTVDPERDLTWIDYGKADRFFAELTEHLEVIPGVEVERVGDGRVDRTTVVQDDLTAPSLAALAECVSRIPNTDDLFPTREDYIKIGYAIKAASGLGDGFDVFAEWCARWDGGANDPDTVAADWDRMRPPYSIGWGWLSELGRQFGYEAAQDEFEAVEDARPENIHRDLPEYSDMWLAERVLEEHGGVLRHVAVSNQFYVWSDTHWAQDAVLLADHLVASTLRRQGALLLRHGGTAREAEVARRQAMLVCTSGRVQAVRQLLRADPSVSATVGMFDNDPWVLNTPGGVVDLRTGEISENDPVLMCSRITQVAPDFDLPTPVWDRFLIESTGGDTALQGYLQRLAGYGLTGIAREQTLTFVWGPGGNGKGTWLNTISRVMGSYAIEAPMDSFTALKGERHPTDLAGLVGARLVTAFETQRGRRWDEQRVKVLTGGDPVRARFMRQDFFTFTPQFTLVIAGNHKPAFFDIDDAIRRRIHIVPFTFKPKHRDTRLAEKLEPEWPGILAWAIRGSVMWARDGLTPPESVHLATEEYFDEEDPVQRWIEDRCEQDPAFPGIPVVELYQDWEVWAGSRNEYIGSVKRFSQTLIGKDIQRWTEPGTRRRGFQGIKLKPTEPGGSL